MDRQCVICQHALAKSFSVKINCDADVLCAIDLCPVQQDMQLVSS